MRWNALKMLIRCDREDGSDEKEWGVEVGELASSPVSSFLFSFFLFFFFRVSMARQRGARLWPPASYHLALTADYVGAISNSRLWTTGMVLFYRVSI